eukprot:CAMPEP_0183399686 /NCGR_PEP_ID=MMETSP0370-20130417/12100_1 /TAXON_ID=268820 /ORGANISM="Peridinium aciculiferum, Strain PAER-2" /LENGTH=316 /DNA_ID=CAMNT_0025580877 /DNA_START=19 /DNA_END=966 /DNA_ORIENTATION=+
MASRNKHSRNYASSQDASAKNLLQGSLVKRSGRGARRRTERADQRTKVNDMSSKISALTFATHVVPALLQRCRTTLGRDVARLGRRARNHVLRRSNLHGQLRARRGRGRDWGLQGRLEELHLSFTVAVDRVSGAAAAAALPIADGGSAFRSVVFWVFRPIPAAHHRRIPCSPHLRNLDYTDKASESGGNDAEDDDANDEPIIETPGIHVLELLNLGEAEEEILSHRWCPSTSSRADGRADPRRLVIWACNLRDAQGQRVGKAVRQEAQRHEVVAQQLLAMLELPRALEGVAALRRRARAMVLEALRVRVPVRPPAE